ncbi:hypothetical protein [Vibrio aestuarianus]|uniref:hypothetical protein n=2 Tax=Vibrio aestuarianus TaxID=28171 RepID=UPI0014472EE6|nr:hypothetical protein [Vibrio aestuarianus]MDE1212679.1 hypothetical protein [Vibrio aestuarianus]MDE1215687.1 hypothetical protein [Vibrio aestuarianus]MDE1226981.1 hypothetical protein [Vibrio aestuarianus]MDE1259789.1 hypothetical protein [Vibrio aestuarianus]MDE1268454.1 hypothetical protein [Vibrio aestuarianus]
MYLDCCHELGFPSPYEQEKQSAYVLRLLVGGFKLDTRKARYMGIGNLHSIVSNFQSKAIPFTLDHQLVECPKEKAVIPHRVDVIWMTRRQRIDYLKMKKAPKGYPWSH